MTININIERSGFSVKIGEFEFWFDTSNEAMQHFINIDQIVNDRYNAYLAEISERSAKGEFDDAKKGEITEEVIGQAIELERKQVEIKYDALFGDGTFAKLYEKYPDYLALDDALNQADILIGEELKKITEERANKVNERTSQYLQKAEKKKRKTKK
ncbi:hypothetical protein [Streptococcus sp. AM43-2AT]|uniref:hypothetical protein n=1 Tax=Streptococcus sp. AM43-2AT TaxID=2293247 RepID=UPI000EC24A4F|nr:hypothetical protein [Streptococcus sp. AM43-2AT]RJU23414.1 hypothetical protein DW930_09015 [Streptococcus sp. AM43-2AT]